MLISITEAAKLMETTSPTVRQMLRTGKLKAYSIKPMGKKNMIESDDCEAAFLTINRNYQTGNRGRRRYET